MKPKYFLKEVYYALISNKVRSGLTVLGIVIGIGSVIAMLAIGQGSKNSIESSITSLGANLITVSPGVQRTNGGYQVRQAVGTSQSLTIEDAKAISSEILNINAISPELNTRQQITAIGTNANTQIVGVTDTYPIVRNIGVEYGNFIDEGSLDNFSKIAVIGPTVANTLFGEDADPNDVVGQKIRIKQMEFTIIGITKEKGGTGFNNQDDMVFIPITTMQKFIISSKNKYVSGIYIQAVDQKNMKQVQEDVTNLLLNRHNISDENSQDFTVLNQNDMVSTASSITSTFTALLGSVAAISLVVGGIGIMNMMLTTVTERTNEIGLRKAIGAKSKDINLQFLIEAISLTLIGGVLGVSLGFVISLLISKFGGISASVSVESVLLAFGVSALIGVVFGYYPAKRASKLSPIEALRYE